MTEKIQLVTLRDNFLNTNYIQLLCFLSVPRLKIQFPNLLGNFF